MLTHLFLNLYLIQFDVKKEGIRLVGLRHKYI